MKNTALKNSGMKRFSLTLAAALMLAMPAAAQDKGHEGHDHSGHTHSTSSMPKPDIDYVFTESPDDHVIGEASAPVTIIAYASVTCPHCSEWFINEWPTFKTEQIDSGNVRFVMREYPTAPRDLAMVGFIIANCAPKDEYFDNLVHQMKEQSATFEAAQTGKAREAFNAMGKKAGLDTEAEIQACFDDPSGVARINRAILRAQASEIQGVPAFYVNGTRYPKEPSAKNLSAAINNVMSAGVSAMPKPAAPKPAKKSISDLFEGN